MFNFLIILASWVLLLKENIGYPMAAERLAYIDPSEVDYIIQRLTNVRSAGPGKQLVELLETEIRKLCPASKDIFLQQPNLLELKAPIKICGSPPI